MEDLLTEIDRAAGEGYLYIAVMAALSVPDIAGGLTAENGQATGKRYVAWFDRWLGGEYGNYLIGLDAYYFRCSLLHQGRTVHGKSRLDRIMFVAPNPYAKVHLAMTVLGGEAVLTLDAEQFCVDMTAAGRRWLAGVRGSQPFERNFRRYARRYEDGYPPHIVGVPVIT